MADNNANTIRTTEQQRVKEITDKLEEGLKELFESEKYKSYLNTMSKFHNYSFNNTLLIAMQKPEATLVAGYKAWQKNFDRHVNKGEKAIRILAPAPYKIKEERDKLDPVTGELLFDENGMPQKENVEITIPAFRPVSVFDVSQTDGKPIPELETAELLQTVEGYEDFVKALMEGAPVPIGFEDIPGESKGYFHTEEKRIAVQENMSESQTLKTMVHEVAHSMLHNKELNKDMDAPVKDRNTKEVEAESIAYTVCQHFGIDTSDYSFGYIAGWSSGKEMTELKASLDTIRRTASELITGIEGQLQALQLERAMELAQEKESLLLVQTTDLSEYSLLNVRGMDAQELVAALADMSEDDKLSVQAYLESKGAWTTEIANQDTKEFEEYHLDVRYFTDRDEIVDVSKAREQQAEENLSVIEKAEALIGALEANKTLYKRVLKKRRQAATPFIVDGYSRFLFLNRNGLPKLAANYESMFRGLAKKYNKHHETALPKVMTPHTLRHTFCTNLANAGMNPKALQYIMGHSNINMTLNYYAHATPDNAMAEMERLIA